MYSECESPMDAPLSAALRQNAAIVFHRGGSSPRFLMNDAIMAPPTTVPQAPNITQLGKSPKSNMPRKASVPVAKAAQAFNPVSVMVPPISDEDRFKNDRTGTLSKTNKFSFERASKQYYLHQQKMLRKEQMI